MTGVIRAMPASFCNVFLGWNSVAINDIVLGVGDLWLESRAIGIEQSITNVFLSPRSAPRTRYTLGRNPDSIVKIRFLYIVTLFKKLEVKIATIATDRHLQAAKTIKSLYPHINHQFDVWPMTKAITKRLNSASKSKGNEDLQPWIRSIANHF